MMTTMNSMATAPKTTVYYGSVISSETISSYTASPRALLAVNPKGFIDWIEHDVDNAQVQRVLKHKFKDRGMNLVQVEFVELDDGEFLMPGLVDTHTHAPQFPNIGTGQQYELLDWLENVTFPMESRFADEELAKRIYPSVVNKFINSGTTTCCYYGSLHLDSTKVLADAVNRSGQRAFVGKCNMDRNSPDHYREPSSAFSIKATIQLIAYIRALKNDLVQPILTPRFAISCTDELLSSIGNLAAADPTLPIQTHISENVGEIEAVKELFPDCTSYADVYDKHGLLGPRTILAHGVHLTEEELVLIKTTGAGISHCPTSNFNLRSGMARVADMLDREIKVGLGTDVSGGFSTSLLTVIQHASMCSKMVALLPPPPNVMPVPGAQFGGKQLNIANLFYLATMGGARLCNLEHRIGSLEAGKSFDALLVTMKPESGQLGDLHADSALPSGDPFDRARLDGHLERFLFCGDDRNIVEVFVQGRCIGGTAFFRARPDSPA